MKRQLSSRVHIILGSLLILGPWSAHNAQAAVECSQASVQSVAPANTSIVSAMAQSDPVAFCDVLGYVTTTNPGPNQVNFELGLPMQWNGRFLFIGNGFFAGSLEFPAVFFDSINPFPFTTQVSAGFATAITDTGHQADVGDASWALNDPGKQDDWLYRGVHVSAVAAKAIVRAVYGSPSRSYFAGCSDGGREGLVEAERYPYDFDGIAVGDPLLGNAFLGFNWIGEHLTATPDNYIPPEKLALVDATVMQSCDAADGVPDGLIQDPRKCTFDPVKLLCTQGDDSNCLTAGQVSTLKAIYSGAKARGQQIYPGFTNTDATGNPDPLFGEDGWDLWITGFESPNAPGTSEPWVDPETPPFQFIGQDQFLKFFVFGDPNFDSLAFNIDSNDLLRTESVINREGAAATNADLSVFKKRGGKLLLYHGWSDPALTPLETVDYYNSVIRSQGGLQPTQQFARLFMLPGMRHCIGSGPGPNVFDPLASLINWVEGNLAPKRIIATHFQDNDPSTGVVTRTMPLCSFPETAHFNGGDVNDASNWSCRRAAE